MGFFDFLKSGPKTAPAVPPLRSEACENCGMPASLLDEVDFNKSCMEPKGKAFPKSGRMVAYFLCDSCGFCFAPEFRTWTLKEFVDEIYNVDYVKVDPEYVFERPHTNAAELERRFGPYKDRIRHLDYGGGSGLLSKILDENGWDTCTHDPVVDAGDDVTQLGKFNFVTAFEVFEHVPDINALADTLTNLCDDDGVIFFTTLCSDGSIQRGRHLDWWYAAPRNGHISLFSTRSLEYLFRKRDLTVISYSSVMHVAFRSRLPDWFEQSVNS